MNDEDSLTSIIYHYLLKWYTNPLVLDPLRFTMIHVRLDFRQVQIQVDSIGAMTHLPEDAFSGHHVREFQNSSGSG